MLKNQTQQDVVTLPSGLQYKILEKGQGAKPDMSDIVRVDFEGRLLDGTVFSNQGIRDIHIGDAIPGLQEALTKMNSGDHWEIFVPAQLGWGMQERALVKPNSLLIFNMRLIEIIQ